MVCMEPIRGNRTLVFRWLKPVIEYIQIKGGRESVSRRTKARLIKIRNDEYQDSMFIWLFSRAQVLSPISSHNYLYRRRGSQTSTRDRQ